MPKVSVIVPAYNAEKYIEECVRSLLNQTLDDIEIIIIDDGSTDLTAEIVKRLISDHSNAFLYRQKNNGLYKTREIGLSLAKGDYIGWVDADDYCHPDMYRILYETALETDSELVYCDYAWIPKKINTKDKWYREYNGAADANYVEWNSQPWNKIVKRELMDKLKIGSFFQTCLDEIYIMLLLQAKSPVAVPKELYYYRIHQGTMSTSYKDVPHYEKFIEASKALKTAMESYSANSKYWKDYFEYRVIYYTLITMLVAANAANKDKYIQYRKVLFSMNPKYTANQHFKPVIDKNFGKLKSLVIRKMIPMNYSVARLACRIGFRKKG